jgi:hypothetical protein
MVFPSWYSSLYGRSEDVGETLRLISPDSPYTGVAIQAIGGMGKTALARECCIAGEVWNSYEFVLGAQARKRQMRIDPRAPKNRLVRFVETGTLLRPRDFLVAVGEQLQMQSPASRTDADLEREIVRRLSGRSALFLLDNLETMENVVEVVALLERIGSPSRKSLITTRGFPAEHPEGLTVLPLWAIRDRGACREVVLDRVKRSTTLIPDNAMDAILDVARGHPLALELLSGKLVAQGPGSIVALRADWERKGEVVLDDTFETALCDYVFDHQFVDSIGSTGIDLLEVIAFEDHGIDEDTLRGAAALPDQDFDAALAKLMAAGCVRREIRGQQSMFTMHSITQAHFRKAAEA